MTLAEGYRDLGTALRARTARWMAVTERPLDTHKEAEWI